MAGRAHEHLGADLRLRQTLSSPRSGPSRARLEPDTRSLARSLGRDYSESCKSVLPTQVIQPQTDPA